MATPRSNASHSKRHESFAASAVLPGENPEEFDMLVSVIRDRLQPIGYLEEQQVVTIAEFSWRKRRLGIFRVAANARARFGACFAEGDIEIGVTRIYEQRFKELEIMLKRKQKTQPLLEKLKKTLAEPPDIGGTNPPGKSQSKPMEGTSNHAGLDAEKRAKADEAEIHFALLGDLISPDCYVQELELIERLDAGIEHALDRLAKYQARRKSGFLPGSDRRNQRWARVRQ